jgi:4-diphosphocytidyl-2-C-methyl-D-erythritol kinase
MHALVAGDPHGVARHLVNDLQPAAIALLPTLQDVVDAFEETAALAAIVSGSGPTVAALAARPEDAAEIAASVAAAGVASDVLVVSGPALGARLVESVVSDPD